MDDGFATGLFVGLVAGLGLGLGIWALLELRESNREKKEILREMKRVAR